MKTAYVIILLILIAIMAFCLVQSIKQKNACTKSINQLLIAGMIGSVAYCGFLMSATKPWATFFESVYFFMCDYLCVFMLQYVFEYGRIERKRKYLKWIVLILIVIDTISLLINNITPWMFQLVEKVDKRTGATFYAAVFSPPHYWHLFLCYVMVAIVFAVLLVKVFSVASIYKNKYLAIFVPLVALIVINAFCYVQGLQVDASVCLYGVLSIIICVCTYRLVPERIIYNAQSSIVANVKKGLLCFDVEGQCIYINHIVKVNTPQWDLQYQKQIEEYFGAFHKKYSDKNVESQEWYEVIQMENEERTMEFSYQSLLDEKKRPMGYFMVVEDKTEDIRLYEQEAYKATHDMLTGLYNRYHFLKEADRIIQENPNKKRWFVVSDIKDFKLVNNVYGTEYGDEVLKQQANMVRRYETNGTICGRIAGDRFAMLIDRDELDLEPFKKAVKELQDYTQKSNYKVQYNIGYYDITGVTDSAAVIYNNLSLAIATIKDNYDQLFVEYNDEMMELLMKPRNMVSKFDEALKEKQFEMYLQPQIDKNGNMAGAEALVRWNHPKQGLIFPGDFIEPFENAGIIHKLDLYIWEEAVKKLAEWKKEGKDNVHISINISVKDFYYLDVYKEIVHIVEKYGINPKLLKLEITESAVLMDKDNNFKTMKSLREYGFEVEIDDFGSGYSSLNMLKDIDADVLKIDRIFLKETDNRDRSKAILNTVVSLAKQLDMSIVVEGVEELRQVEYLVEIGCNIFQGFYFDKPMPVSAFEEKYMKENN